MNLIDFDEKQYVLEGLVGGEHTVSPNGMFVAVRGVSEEGTKLIVINTTDQKRKEIIFGTMSLRSITFSPDNEYMAYWLRTVEGRASIQILDTNTWAQKYTADGYYRSEILELSFTPDSQFIVYTTYRGFAIWKFQSDEDEGLHKHFNAKGHVFAQQQGLVVTNQECTQAQEEVGIHAMGWLILRRNSDTTLFFYGWAWRNKKEEEGTHITAHRLFKLHTKDLLPRMVRYLFKSATFSPYPGLRANHSGLRANRYLAVAYSKYSDYWESQVGIGFMVWNVEKLINNVMVCEKTDHSPDNMYFLPIEGGDALDSVIHLMAYNDDTFVAVSVDNATSDATRGFILTNQAQWNPLQVFTTSNNAGSVSTNQTEWNPLQVFTTSNKVSPGNMYRCRVDRDSIYFSRYERMASLVEIARSKYVNKFRPSGTVEEGIITVNLKINDRWTFIITFDEYSRRTIFYNGTPASNGFERLPIDAIVKVTEYLPIDDAIKTFLAFRVVKGGSAVKKSKKTKQLRLRF
jgi:hypothetical protein